MDALVKGAVPIMQTITALVMSIQIDEDDDTQIGMKMITTTQNVSGVAMAEVPILKLQNAELRTSLAYVRIMLINGTITIKIQPVLISVELSVVA